MLIQVALLLAQSYSGPAPAKADVPYLLHADSLVITEMAEAVETKGKDGSTFTISGANSKVKTPLASPIFIFKAGDLNPEKLQVFPLTSADGHREITFSRGNNPQVYTLTVKKLSGSLYRLEVNESLPVGEYSIVPSTSHQAFCFAVY